MSRPVLLKCSLLLAIVATATAGGTPPLRKKFLGANWKANLRTTDAVDNLVDDLNRMWRSLSKSETDAVELCVNPPYVFLDRVRQRLHEDIGVGGQNVYDASGPNREDNTGTTTASMLKDIGCAHVLLGHSDRRNRLGETDDLISDKVRAALDAGLGVTLTIGELKYQRNWGLALWTLKKQLSAAARSIPVDAWDKIVVAYEPVWSVGEGAVPCSPQEAQRVNAYLRSWIRENAGDEAAGRVRLTYTGSVDEKNAASYAGLDDVDGFVVGRAGLNTDRLGSIVRTLASSAASCDSGGQNSFYV
mmetsp:Transcript_11187/g.22121  ORF Transcript_11187/g.22121 Transcript_11187/m.22121 type:complete len:303 (+) Transcript_11187:53-961(+)